MPNEVCSKILATVCPASELQYQVGASKVNIILGVKDLISFLFPHSGSVNL